MAAEEGIVAEEQEQANFAATQEDENTEESTSFDVDEDKGEAVVVKDPEEEDQDDEEVRGKKGEIPPENATDEDKELSEHSKRVEKRINQLTYKATQSKNAESEAMNYAKGLHAENEDLKKRLKGQENVSVTEAEERNKSQMAEARTALRTAHTVGDPDGIADATELIGKLAADANVIQRVKNRRASTESQEQPPNRGIEGRDPAPPPPEDTRTLRDIDPKAADWVEKTEWFGNHQGMTDYAMQQHYELESQGVDLHSDGYYAEIEKRVESMFPHMFKGNAGSPEAPAGSGASEYVGGTKPKQTVAPAGSSSGSARSKKGSTRVELSPSEKAVARGIGVSYEAYAREKLKRQREEEAENA